MIDLNLSSYKTVEILLENLHNWVFFAVNREWLCIGFDGVPYPLANEIIYALDQCTAYGEIIYINELTHEKHVRSIHGKERIIFKNYLGDILLAAGAGNMEKYLLLAIFTLS